MFMILVVNTHARVISWAGVCGDRLATMVIRRGAIVASASCSHVGHGSAWYIPDTWDRMLANHEANLPRLPRGKSTSSLLIKTKWYA
jgi:hypothetical protein